MNWLHYDYMSVIKNGIKIITFVIVLILLMEFIFFVLYNFTGSKYFESYIETLQRYGDNKPYNQSKFLQELKSDSTKIAVFGGSSSNGYGSQVRFSDLIDKIYSEDLVVHNYARNGDPFVGFQSELLKVVAPLYDVIIIYSGHNEFWSHLYLKSSQIGKDIELFNGYKIKGKETRLAYNIEVSKLRHKLERGIFFSWIFEGRLTNFSRRILTKILFLNINKKNKKISVQNKVNKISKDPLFLDHPVITEKEKAIIIKRYFQELAEIEGNLNENQKLLISTVLSNDLYPPLMDTLNSKELPISIVSKYFNDIYDKLESGSKIDISILNKLPDGAHKSFVQASLCVMNSEILRTTWKKCVPLLTEARSLDALPYRVLEEINNKIRTWKGKAIVIDPAIKLPFVNKEYLEYFVDFQHPSTKGHILIANEIAKALNLQQLDVNHKLIFEKCGRFKWCELSRDSNVECTKDEDENERKFLKSTSNNLKWLEKRVDSAARPHMHFYYLEKVRSQINTCPIDILDQN